MLVLLEQIEHVEHLQHLVHIEHLEHLKHLELLVQGLHNRGETDVHHQPVIYPLF